MNKRYLFLSGLPRSGSTILCGILSQNPSLYVSGTSNILGVLANIRAAWQDIAEFSALDPKVSATRKLNVLRGALDAFYADVPQQIVIDKCRAWPAHLEMAESMLGYKPKVIVTVRDVRDVLASFEKLWRKRKAENCLVDAEKSNPIDYLSIDGRCRVLMNPGGMVGSSANIILDACVRGWRKQLHFVEYENLTEKPKETLSQLYAFLELESFEHDFANIQPSVIENDVPYGWGDLHTIRPELKPQPSQWQDYIPTNVAMQYTADAKFWRGL